MKGLFMIVVLALSVCTSSAADKVVTEKRQVNPFHEVEASGAFKITVSDKVSSVEISTTESQMKYVETKVVEGELKLRFTKNNMKERVEVTLPLKAYNKFEMSGACALILPNNFTTDELDIEASGAVSVSGHVACRELDIDTSGASSVKIAGTVDKLSIDVSGASKVNTIELKASNVEVDASGACKIEVNAAKRLEVESSGASKIGYTGECLTRISSSGASKVYKL